ncbi:hypothetical protein AKN92_09765 [Thiopseudomonas alkaliphila]|nr:hypothetical protein AKN92_09765 [Thiopseudomonas alkaliphila]
MHEFLVFPTLQYKKVLVNQFRRCNGEQVIQFLWRELVSGKVRVFESTDFAALSHISLLDVLQTIYKHRHEALFIHQEVGRVECIQRDDSIQLEFNHKESAIRLLMPKTNLATVTLGELNLMVDGYRAKEQRL